MIPAVPAAGFVTLVVLVTGLPLGVWARGAGRSLWPSRVAGAQARFNERTGMETQAIPSTPQEVAAAVLDAIKANPGSFSMSSWFSPHGSGDITPDQNVCGTTMCAAGWAAHLTGWTLLVRCCDESPDCVHDEPMAKKGDKTRPVELVGAEALGLEVYETFFYEDEDTALERLREIAGR